MEPVKSNAMRNAWLWLVGLPVAYVATALIGYSLGAALGFTEGELFPAGWALLMLFVGIVLFGIPTYFAYSNGRSAQSAGSKRPFLPALIALFVVVWFVLTGLLSLIFA